MTGTLGKALGRRGRRLRRLVGRRCATCSRSARGRSCSRTRCRRRSRAAPAPRCTCSATRPDLVSKLRENTRWFRGALRERGFNPLDGEAAIIPIIVGETARAIEVSQRLLDRGVFVTGFGYPVVPEGTARIRVQMSAALEPVHLERALEAFVEVGREAGLVAA